MVNVSSTELQETIRNAADSLNDGTMLAKVQCYDLIACKAKYHKNCLGKYLRSSSRASIETQSVESNDIFSDAFQQLIHEISERFERGAAFDMSHLLKRYIYYLHQAGYANADSYRAERLKVRLKRHFKDKINFHATSNQSQPELIHCTAVRLQDTIEKIASTHQLYQEETVESELNMPADSYEYTSVNIAMELRSTVRAVKGITWPNIDTNDISEEMEERIVPPELYQFLCTLMMGESTENVKKDSAGHRRVLSTAQDIIFAASNSRCKTPKHVGLAVSVKHLTGSRQVIDLIHSQGHSISYDDLCRTESAIATKVSTNASELGKQFLPTNIIPGKFSHAAMDNIDINEETRSGKGTTHVLGSLIYQEESNDKPIVPKDKPVPTRQKSIKNLVGTDVLECPNRYAKNMDTTHLRGKINHEMWFSDEQQSISIDKAIVFARLCPTRILEVDFKPLRDDEQKVPSWKGMHAVLRHTFSETSTKSTIGYNPVIRGNPTDWNTIYTGLKLVEQQMWTIGQDIPVITLDLQLYSIAQAIRLRNWEEFGHHILRLGGFHIMELYWKIIGKRFSASGLEDILIEADVFGPNAMSMIMQGGHYKRCTLAHRLMHEVMCRLEFQGFLKWLVSQDKLPEDNADLLETTCSNLQATMDSLLSDTQIQEDKHGAAVKQFEQLIVELQQLTDLYKEFVDLGRR